MIKNLSGILFLWASCCALGQENRIDIIRHDAPELAYFGEHEIGVRTIELVDPKRADILNLVEGDNTIFYDRKLMVEIWYPAQLSDNQPSGGTYSSATRNTVVTATLHGKAVREAEPLQTTSAFPLIIISHGYPGNRYLMSHAAENLSSKGYVVVAIDHRDSTYLDQQPVASAIYHQPLDQVFVLDQVADLAANPNSFLHGIVDANRTGIIGYSFGGFALINNAGGGFSEATVNSDVAPVNCMAFRHAADNPEYHESLDERIKAGVAVAPWGMASGVWEPADLAGIRIPMLFMAGSADETSGYEDGVRALFLRATMSDRYLLTYENAGHNAIAPIPLPIEITRTEDQVGASHYTDAVWDSVRSANIMNHFSTAFFDLHLKGETVKRAYFELVTDSNDGVWSMQDGKPGDTHSYWMGFPRYSARGLRLEHRSPGE